MYALTLEAGTLNLQLERIPLNALAPVFAVVSFVLKIVTLESLLQPQKAFAPTVIIFAPIFTVVSFFAPDIAEVPMAVTRKLFPPIFTVVGIVRAFLAALSVAPVKTTVPLPDVSALDILYFSLLTV